MLPPYMIEAFIEKNIKNTTFAPIAKRYQKSWKKKFAQNWTSNMEHDVYAKKFKDGKISSK